MSSETSSSDLLGTYDIIFSCTICQTTISELYKEIRTDHGFSSGIEDGIITRLWLTECGHLTCGDCLDGGGAPFHPKEQKISAPCPLCASEQSDSTPRQLYAIHGPHPNQHDKAIPDDYFHVPPNDLNRSSKSALRFQYLALVRFSRSMAKRYRELSRASNIREAQSQDLATSLRETRKEAAELRVQVDALKVVERKHEKLEQRMPEVRHYLNNFAATADENTMMKRQLRRLGLDVPQTTWSLNTRPTDEVLRAVGDPSTNVQQKKHLQQSTNSISHASSSSERKRTRQDFLKDTIAGAEWQPQPVDSMAPPPRPQHRQNWQIDAATQSSGVWPVNQAARTEQLPVHSRPSPRSDEFVSGTLPLRNTFLAPSSVAARHSYEPDGFIEPRRMAVAEAEDNSGRFDSNQQPLHSAPMRQLFIPLAAERQPQQRQSDYQAMFNHDATDCLGAVPPIVSDQLPTRSQAPRVATHSPFSSANESRMAPPSRLPVAPTRSRQLEQGLTPAFGRMHMNVSLDQEPTSQSLNDLSFIQEPYTQSNKPVFNRPDSRVLWSRHQAQHKPQQSSASSQNMYVADPRVSASLSSASLPWASKNRVNQSRDPSMQLSSLKGVKASVLPGLGDPRSRMLPSTNGARFPYQQSRGVGTASGRRSVMR